jgi:hypothetical protein
VSEPRIPQSDSTPEQPGASTQTVAEYIESNIDRYTAEALKAAALEAGYTERDVTLAIVVASARRAGTRARRVVYGAYLLTYLVLAVALVTRWGGFALIPIGILTGAIALAFLASTWWLEERSGLGFLGLLGVPLLLLAVVGGLCLYTADPFGSGI